jgi:histidinol-phosphate aminotransferase
VSLIDTFDNLLVVQTLSKSRSLAGLRVGLAMGAAELIEALERVKDSFNSYPLDILAQRGATAAFEDAAWHADCCARVVRSRETLRAGLQAQGFEVLPSAANFVFARHPSASGRDLFEALRERGIIVRRWDKPRIDDYLRISVGTDADVERVLAAVGEIIGACA